MKNKLLLLENIFLIVVGIFIVYQNLPYWNGIDGIILAIVVVNIFLARQFLLSDKKSNLKLENFTKLTQLTIFWWIFLFANLMFASNLWLLVANIILTTTLFIVLRKFSKKIALLNLVFMFFIFTLSILFNFEEDYCWNQGTKAAMTGSEMVPATAADVELLRGSLPDIKIGDSVGISWLAHSRCHKSFNLVNGLNDAYLSPITSMFSNKHK